MTEAQRERKRAWERRYYAKVNRAKKIAASRAWNISNKDKTREYSKRWYSLNKEYYHQWYLDQKAIKSGT